MRTSETRCFGGLIVICSKTTGCVAVQAVCVFCLVVCIYARAWAACYKTHRTHKTPYKRWAASLVVVADYSIKTAACRADLRRCCVSMPEIPLLQQKICAAVFCVVLKIYHLVICSNWLNEQECGHTKVLPDVLLQCAGDEMSELAFAVLS